jgi:general secretion pathway protein G
MYKRKLQRGFTLIELIIVMAIMGLLIGIVASSFQTSRIKGKDARRKSDLKQVQNALEAYINDHGTYPVSTAGVITACGAGNATCAWGSPFTDQNGTVYMAQLPSDANAPTFQYQYLVSSDHKMYQLYAYIEDTQDADAYNYNGVFCGVGTTCNYGLSSPNTTPKAILP